MRWAGYRLTGLAILARLADENEEDFEGGESPHNQSGAQMNQMNQMMQMMMQMQQQNNQPSGNPYNIVDQKMAMDWLNHCMSFLFRSLTQQMAMFERSTKMIEIYSMRFGLPQPLERPSPERIIREVPMDFPQQAGPPPAPEPSGLGILPALLQAAASLASSPGAANMLKTAGGLAAGMGQKPTQSPPPQQQLPPQPKPTTRREKIGKPAKYKKSQAVQHAEPINDVDEFGWDGNEESPPMNIPQGTDQYMFGLDGSNRNPINPFQGGSTSINENAHFQEMEDEDELDMTHDDALGLNLQMEGDHEIELPEDFPDLNGMSADEMKQTVIDWINADPDNRKGQIMEMLPELSSLIL